MQAYRTGGDKCLCIIPYSRDGVFDIVPVPSPVQNGRVPPQALRLDITLRKTPGNASLV